MSATVHHVQLNVKPEHLGFYRDLMAALGWPTLYDDHGVLGCGGPASLWFAPAADHPNNRDGAGLNHVGLAADSVDAVERAAAWLAERGVPALYDTPRHRPDFSWEEGMTYYQVMFDSPDGILFEIVYTGPHPA